jgi:general secretion pathway protein D
MHLTRNACVALALLTLTGTAYAQSQSPAIESATVSTTHVENGVPIAHLIATVAKKTGKKFVIDPRVRGEAVIVGQDPSNVTYGDLLTVLHVYFYTAVESGGYVNVIPDASVRQSSVPEVTGKESRPDAEFVTKVIVVKNQSAAQMVPILRPLIPQVGHLAAFPCSNRLILVDTFANVQRLQRIIDELDVGEPLKMEKCEVLPQPPRENH